VDCDAKAIRELNRDGQDGTCGNDYPGSISQVVFVPPGYDLTRAPIEPEIELALQIASCRSITPVSCFSNQFQNPRNLCLIHSVSEESFNVRAQSFSLRPANVRGSPAAAHHVVSGRDLASVQ
jgi:hypothetical protein